MIDFEVEPEFQAKLDWMAAFVKEQCEPLDLLFPYYGAPYNVADDKARRVLKPLQAKVREQGLWACHLGPELGGPGYGQIKLALMNEILGRSVWAPTVFGTAAPDTGNAEILAMFGTPEQKKRYLQPLMDGEIVSSFAMTEPQAGADPKEFTCKAWREGDEWVVEGEKWFASNGCFASFFILLAVTNPENPIASRMSMFVVPAETPGLDIIRNVKLMGEAEELDGGTHSYIHFNRMRLPLDAMLGSPGEGFKVAQARLGGGRVHHAMRTVGLCQRAIDAMMERAVSRRAQGRNLGDHQFVQGMIADSVIELEQYRLLVLKAAWIIDTQPHGAARTHIAMCKVAMAKIANDVVHRAIQLHGSLGVTTEMPMVRWLGTALTLALADGPTEVHKVQVARAILRNAPRAEGLFPSEHIPTRLKAAREHFAAFLD